MRISGCVLCNKQNARQISSKVRDSIEHKIVQCINCKHIQLYPIPSKEDDKKFYDKNLQLKNTGFNGSINQLRMSSKNDVLRRVEFVRNNTPKKGKILEIGSGYGFFLEEISKLGFKVTGSEISRDRMKQLKKLENMKIINLDLDSEIPKLGVLDTIVMFHVLEHIIDPINYLKKLKPLLKPNGHLIIEVPNCNDLLLKNNSSYKNWYWQRAHIHYFTKHILKKILSRSGFHSVKIFGIQRYGIENMFNWRINLKPQLDKPSFKIDKDYEWLEKNYKNYLEKKISSDTIIAISTK